MNKVILMGRLTRDPDVRYSRQDNKVIARYNLAVDRRGKDKQADFISCVAFGKSGEFTEKYLHKGTKIIITGRIQTGSYTKQDGTKVYTTDVVVEDQEFAESKTVSGQTEQTNAAQNATVEPNFNDFMSLPDDIDEELPFH